MQLYGHHTAASSSTCQSDRRQGRRPGMPGLSSTARPYRHEPQRAAYCCLPGFAVPGLTGCRTRQCRPCWLQGSRPSGHDVHMQPALQPGRPAMNGSAHCSTYCLSAHTCDLRQGAILTRDIRADRFLTVITQKPLAHMHAYLPALTSSVSVRFHLLIPASPLACNHLHTRCSGRVIHSAAADAASCSRELKARCS